jgi:hypothetical protein
VPQPDPLLEIAELSLKELGRRLNDDPETMPSHVLSKVAADTMRVIDRREKIEEEESRPFVLRDELPTLPPKRAKALVKEEIGRLKTELAACETVLRELEASDGEEEIPAGTEERTAGAAGEAAPAGGGVRAG